MTLQEIKKMAQQVGIPASGTKVDLIKSIQRNEGNFDCFGTASTGFCDQNSCIWRTDCLKPSKKAQ
ncbi:MAG: SAP domain-containing protein [Nitrospirae bacterium]|nr:SAP domain-containing protein [Nitrospirota bacterium]